MAAAALEGSRCAPPAAPPPGDRDCMPEARVAPPPPPPGGDNKDDEGEEMDEEEGEAMSRAMTPGETALGREGELARVRGDDFAAAPAPAAATGMATGSEEAAAAEVPEEGEGGAGEGSGKVVDVDVDEILTCCRSFARASSAPPSSLSSLRLTSAASADGDRVVEGAAFTGSLVAAAVAGGAADAPAGVAAVAAEADMTGGQEAGDKIFGLRSTGLRLEIFGSSSFKRAERRGARRDTRRTVVGRKNANESAILDVESLRAGAAPGTAQSNAKEKGGGLTEVLPRCAGVPY